MDRLNRERQLIEEQIFRLAQDRFSAEPALARQWVIVLEGEGWHRGVIGIVATKVSEKYHRPVLVVSTENGIGYGSGRSPKNFNLLKALDSCADLFDRFGGHAQAAGFQIPTRHVEELRRRLNEHAASAITEQDLEPTLEVDSELRLSDIDEGLFQEVEKLAPFGPANPQPVFVARDLAVIAEPRVLKGKHLKFRVEQDGRALDVIGWNMAQRQPVSLSGGTKSLAGVHHSLQLLSGHPFAATGGQRHQDPARTFGLNTQIIRLGRILPALVVLAVVGAVCFSYYKRSLSFHDPTEREKKLLPENVASSSKDFPSFNRNRGRARFEIKAKINLGYKDNKNLLESVTVKVFGKDGSRHDTITSDHCEYDEEKEEIVFSGNVVVNLGHGGSAPEQAKVEPDSERYIDYDSDGEDHLSEGFRESSDRRLGSIRQGKYARH